VTIGVPANCLAIPAIQRIICDLDTSTLPRPTASADIEPVDGPERTPRRYSVRLRIEISRFEQRFADRSSAVVAAGGAIGVLDGGADAHYTDVLASKEKLVAVEASAVCADRPDAAAITRMREMLSGAGYNVTVRELRECGDAGCSASAPMDTARPNAAPLGWFNLETCGKHGYRACGNCGSVYVMWSANAGGQAPSIHCEVCGAILVEWGGTKVWTADLVTRKTPPA